MTYKTLTTEQFLEEARVWDIKRRAMRRAALLHGVLDTFMGIFSLVFLALTCVLIAGPGLMALSAFFGFTPT